MSIDVRPITSLTIFTKQLWRNRKGRYVDKDRKQTLIFAKLNYNQL